MSCFIFEVEYKSMNNDSLASFTAPGVEKDLCIHLSRNLRQFPYLPYRLDVEVSFTPDSI